MREILVYKAESEIKDLANKIRSSSSVAYCSPLQQWIPDPSVSAKIVDQIQKTYAGAHDSDLYYTKSVLVTTNWNKNDDVFGKGEVWMARHTPAHKPTNLEHDEHRLVGHITDNWAVAVDGALIPDDIIIDDLPDTYHIINGAVIYTRWSDQELIDRTNKLIEEIEANTKYVSMECLFSDFDYAMLKDGKFSVVPRNEDTAFLTKHLKAYGGDGEYDGQKLGRFLKNITFSGKGYVDKPANPNSIILQDTDVFNYIHCDTTPGSTVFTEIEHNGVSIKCGHDNDDIVTAENNKEYCMSSENILQDQNTELKDRVGQLEAKLVEANDKLAKADVAQYETRISELEQQLETAQSTIQTLEQERDDAVKNAENLQTKYEELEASQADLKKELQEIAVAKRKADRVATLVAGNIDKEVAENKVVLYDNLNDEQFNDIASELIAAVQAKDTSTNDTPDEESEVEAGESEESEMNQSMLMKKPMMKKPMMTTAMLLTPTPMIRC
jgi:hypothetical protein